MKRKIWLTFSVLGLVIVFGFGMYQSNASQGAPILSAEDIKELIASQYPGEVTALELVQDKNDATYDIEIQNEDMIYELLVDGKSGEVLHLKEKIIISDEHETNNDTLNSLEQKPTEKPTKEEDKKVAKNEEQPKVEKKNKEERNGKQNDCAQSHKNHQANKSNHHKDKNKDKQKKEKYNEKKKKKQTHKTSIDAKQAIDIALEHFPGVVEEVELDENNGRLIYEIEIESDGEEAEFEIDAYTGEILVVEIDD